MMPGTTPDNVMTMTVTAFDVKLKMFKIQESVIKGRILKGKTNISRQTIMKINT